MSAGPSNPGDVDRRVADRMGQQQCDGGGRHDATNTTGRRRLSRSPALCGAAVAASSAAATSSKASTESITSGREKLIATAKHTYRLCHNAGDGTSV